RRASARKRGDFRTGRTEERGKAELWKELGFGDTDPRIGAHECLLRLPEIGTALEQGRRQSGRHHGHGDLLVHRLAASNRAGRFAQQDADLVLLGDDVALDLWNVRLRIAECTEGTRRLELRRHAEVEAIEE